MLVLKVAETVAWDVQRQQPGATRKSICLTNSKVPLPFRSAQICVEM